MTYTKEQIDRANQTDLVSFLQAQGEQLERAGQEYRWKRHDSLTVRERGWGMGRQHDFRMNNAAFSCIVVGQSVPLVCQLLSGAVGCCGYGRFALSPADNLNAAMVDCDSITSRYGQQNPMKVNSLQSKVFAFVGYTKG